MTIEQTLNGHRTDITWTLNGSRTEVSVLFHSIVRTEVHELNPRSGKLYYVRVRRTGEKRKCVIE